MKDEEKSKRQLLAEVKKLRQQTQKFKADEIKYQVIAKTLKETEEKYYLLFENMSDGLVLDELIYDDKDKVIDWKICDVNPGYEVIVGIPQKNVLGKRASEVYGSRETIAPYLESYQRALETGTPQHIKLYVEQRNKYLLSSIYPLTGRHVAVIFKDVTDVKRSEEALHHSEEKFRALAETTSAAIFIFQSEDMLFVNHAATAVTGYSAQELTAMKFWDIIHPDFKELVKQRGLARQRKKKVPPKYEVKIITKNDDERWVEFTGKTIMYSGKPAVIGTAVDITERKQMEESLRNSEERFRSFVENCGVGIYLCEYIPPIAIDLPEDEQITQNYHQGLLTYCNDVFAKMYGAEKAEDIIDKMRAVDAHGTDSNIHNRDIFRKFIRSNYQLMNAITEEVDRHGNRLYISNNFIGMVENGYLAKLWGSQQDITEGVLARHELQKTSERLRNLSVHLQTLREEERSRIAREIHDEIGQALTMMKMDVAWLKQKFSDNQLEIQTKLNSMSNFIDTTIETTQQLTGELRPSILDDFGLAAAIEWQCQLIQERTSSQCKVKVEVDPIDLDPERSTAIFRIFQETMTNVMRHSKAKKVEVTLKKQNRALVLKVRDNGTGIRESQISDPKSLGLIGMRERLYPWGGNVDIQGFPGKGTLVSVTLPLMLV